MLFVQLSSRIDGSINRTRARLSVVCNIFIGGFSYTLNAPVHRMHTAEFLYFSQHAHLFMTMFYHSSKITLDDCLSLCLLHFKTQTVHPSFASIQPKVDQKISFSYPKHIFKVINKNISLHSFGLFITHSAHSDYDSVKLVQHTYIMCVCVKSCPIYFFFVRLLLMHMQSCIIIFNRDSYVQVITNRKNTCTHIT